MIYGIGTDIVAVARIETALASHGERFAARILAESELAEFRASSAPARFTAKRFAAKEAFAKALGTGIGAELSWHDLTVTHDAAGKPAFTFSAALTDRLYPLEVAATHLSISDETTHAVAFVVIERKTL